MHGHLAESNPFTYFEWVTLPRSALRPRPDRAHHYRPARPHSPRVLGRVSPCTLGT